MQITTLRAQPPEVSMIEARGLVKHYRSTLAVDNLSFDVRPGTVTGFLGPNGAGKSTSMRIIMGLDRPDAGQARIDGKSYGHLRWPLREVGALLEAKAFHPGRTARAHLAALAASNAIGRRRVDEVLAITGIEKAADRRAGKFSLGMKQRLGIAAALLADPRVLLLDEPVNGLDPEGIRWIRLLLRAMAAEGRTIVVSSHLMSEMAQTADHLIVIGRGRLLADTSTTEFVSRTGQDVLVRSSRAAELAGLLTGGGAVVSQEGDGLAVTGMAANAIGDLAARHGIAVHQLITRHASLEEAYLDLTGASTDYRAASQAPDVPSGPGTPGTPVGTAVR